MMPKSALEFAIDRPSSSPVVEGVLEVTGWCFHREGSISHLQLLIDGTPHDTLFALHRPDVALRVPDAAGAERSGFIATAEVTPGVHRLDLRARVRGLGTVDTTVVPALRVEASGAAKKGLFSFLVEKAWTRLHEGRGIPRWSELLLLLRHARADHQTLAFRPRLSQPPQVEPYQGWLNVNAWTDAAAQDLSERLGRCERLPLISIVTPVFRPNLEDFRATIRSVQEQVLSEWEWCLADDASGDPALVTAIETAARDDPRIRFVMRSTNGHISRASNSAAELARGEFLAFLDHDDLLAPDAIGEVASYLARNPDVDVLYTDDDKIGPDGRRHGPQFKPDWSPESLLSQMYFCHLLVVRRSLFEEVGGFRVGFEGSARSRFSAQVRRKKHVESRICRSSSITGVRRQDRRRCLATRSRYSFEAGLKAIDEAFTRRGLSAHAHRPEWAVAGGASLIAHRFPDTGPSVAVLIPTRNGRELLELMLRR